MVRLGASILSGLGQSSPRLSLGGPEARGRRVHILPILAGLPRPGPAFWIATGLILSAFLIRLPDLGNPAYHIDEEFYLVVGDRLLHGALPYVDIWDRKPVGLFLLYAAIRLLGGDGVIQYQLVATLFAGGTAFLIQRISRPVAGSFAGVIAGLAYLLWIETVEGGGGQAPVFYNLFVAGAAACVIKALSTPDPRRFWPLAFGGMMLGGIAIQVKYTAVFEVAYFGMLLAWSTQRHVRNLTSAAARTFCLALTALGPTLAALFFYVLIGRFQEFWYANFVSIFQRAPAIPGDLRDRLEQLLLHMVPLGLCFIGSLWELGNKHTAEVRRWQWIVSGWLIAACVGFFSVGAFYYHYLLPVLVPLAVAAAPIFRRRPLGYALGAWILWTPFSNLRYPDFTDSRETTRRIAALSAMIPPNVDKRCLQLFGVAQVPPVLYLRSHACTVTPYIFPEHLISRIETPALGVDPSSEIRRLMAKRPLALVTEDDCPDIDRRTFAVLREIRGQFYHRVGRVRFERTHVDVWVLNHPPA